MSRFVSLAFSLGILFFAGCASPQSDSEEPRPDVTAQNYQFSPSGMTAIHGNMVSWKVKNADSVQHSMTQTFNFDLDVELPPGQTTTVAFSIPSDQVGDYQIPCKYHGNMKLSLRVE